MADKCGKLRRIIMRLAPVYGQPPVMPSIGGRFVVVSIIIIIIAVVVWSSSHARRKSPTSCVSLRRVGVCGAERNIAVHPYPCVPPLVTIPFGRPLVRPRRCFRVTMAAVVAVVGNNRAIAAHQQLYSGKINGTITGDRPFLFSHTLLCRRRRW